MMTSNNNTAAKIPMRSLRMGCAAVSTILMFLKWFRVDIGGIAQLFSMDTSFSIFNLSGIVQNVYYEYNTFYRVVFALFVIGGILQVCAAILLWFRHPYSGIVSYLAALICTILSTGAIILCSVVLKDSGALGIDISCTIFPYVTAVLGVVEIYTWAFSSKPEN